jgi:hypothetical protein
MHACANLGSAPGNSEEQASAVRWPARSRLRGRASAAQPIDQFIHGLTTLLVGPDAALEDAGWRTRRGRDSQARPGSCPCREDAASPCDRPGNPGRSRLQELRVAPPLRRDAGVLRFGSAKARRGAFGGPFIFPQSVFAVGTPAVHPRPVQLEALAAITGLFAQLVEAPRLRPSSPPASPASRRSSRALVETSADLL